MEKDTTISSLMSMNGCVSLVTGGGGYLGRSIAAALSELGSDIILLDRDLKQLEIVSQNLTNEFHIRVHCIECDLQSEIDIARVPKNIKDSMGRLDVLVNNAAFVGTSKLDGWCVEFDKQDINTWRQALEVNLTAVFSLCQKCKPLLEASDHASIINIGSIYGMMGPDLSLYEGTKLNNPAAYAASKGGLLQLTRWLATVLAPGTRVNAISPGGIARGQPPSFVEKYVNRTPLQRMGTEDDFKGAVAFLASGLSNWVTGQNIVVDGGWSVW